MSRKLLIINVIHPLTFNGLERSSPAKAIEPGKVPVGGDPFAAVLDGQRREPGVLDEVSVCPGPAAQIDENRPMASAGLNNLAIRLCGDGLAEC